MKVKPAQYGRLMGVSAGTNGILLPTEEQVGAAVKVASASVKKRGGFNTRPLNAYIAYRCYYSPVLATLQQKDISGIMTNLWQSDRCKAKWAILAKAYTLIRDKKGKAKAPLDGFLSLNAPRIGIAHPDEYMYKLGWELALGPNGGAILRRNPENDLTDFTAGALNNASVQDIITHSYDHGYIDARDGDIVKVPENEAVLSMSTSGDAISPVGDTSRAENTNTNAGDSNQGSDNATNGAGQALNDNAQTPGGAQPPPGQDLPDDDDDAMMGGDNMDIALYSPAALDSLLNEIMAANPATDVGQELFPDGNYWAEFIPGSADTLTFDPYALDEHDAIDITQVPDGPLAEFDINQWVEFNPPES